MLSAHGIVDLIASAPAESTACMILLFVWEVVCKMCWQSAPVQRLMHYGAPSITVCTAGVDYPDVSMVIQVTTHITIIVQSPSIPGLFL